MKVLETHLAFESLDYRDAALYLVCIRSCRSYNGRGWCVRGRKHVQTQGDTFWHHQEVQHNGHCILYNFIVFYLICDHFTIILE